MADANVDDMLALAEEAAKSIPDAITKAALREAMDRAFETYLAAPHNEGDAPYTLPSDEDARAILSGPFAVNAERFVSQLYRRTGNGAQGLADLSLAGRSAVVRLVQVYNDQEQTLAARAAGIE